MIGSLFLATLTGCFLFNGGDDDMPVVEPPEEENTDSPTIDPGPGPLPFSRIQVFANFRYDAATGLPGAWTDEEGDEGNSAITFIVGDDQFNGVSGTACVVSIPITAEGATLITDLEEDQYWGVNLQYDPADILSSCSDPAVSRIAEYYDNDVVGFITTNRDGSPAQFGLLVGEPIGDTFTWIQQVGIEIEDEEVIGGTVLLSDRWAQSRTEENFGRAFQTDANGMLQLDDDDELIPIFILDVPQSPGISEGLYTYEGWILNAF